MADWQPIRTAPILTGVLTCRAGEARSVRHMYFGDGSERHPANWIDEHSRDIVEDDWEMPHFWMPAPIVPPKDAQETLDRVLHFLNALQGESGLTGRDVYRLCSIATGRTDIEPVPLDNYDPEEREG